MSGRPIPIHRKLWEWLFIADALAERHMLEPGTRGLGFGVGNEPLTALFASLGCTITATDADEETARAGGWQAAGQYAKAVDDLNAHGLCDPEQFAENVAFRIVDMNNIPRDLRGYDFTWSSCALEHLGSIVQGKAFLLHQLDCLRPGGIAVHTTEFNLSSNTRTVDFHDTVLFRRRDLERLLNSLQRGNHSMKLDLDPGTTTYDRHVDDIPYTEVHLRVRLGPYVCTSVGLIIEKNPYPPLLTSAGPSAWEVAYRVALTSSTWAAARYSSARQRYRPKLARAYHRLVERVDIDSPGLHQRDR